MLTDQHVIVGAEARQTELNRLGQLMRAEKSGLSFVESYKVILAQAIFYHKLPPVASIIKNRNQRVP